MNPLYARYPYFESAREAVEAVDVSLPALVAERAPPVERGRERVERALVDGTTAAESPRRWGARDELLSYPVARILVSLLDAPAAVEKYAAAEAATARERFVSDVESDDELRSTGGASVNLDALLREFSLDDAVVAVDGSADGRDASGAGRFSVEVGAYLALADADWGDGWRLVNRDLRTGRVPVERDELYRLLEEAVRRRVAEGLPFEGLRDSSGGERLADALEPEIADLRDLLSARNPTKTIDTVVPELFPPCLSRLTDRARRGAALDPHERFALLAFLTAIGMETDEIVAFCEASSIDPEAIRYQTEFLRDGSGAQFPPPSCETLEAYGICENEDDHRSVASHPLAYYERRLADADGEAITDWRRSETA